MTIQKKRILIITPSFKAGGGEKVAANLSIGPSKYFDVYLVADDNLSVDYEIKGEIVPISNLPAKGKFKKIKNLLNKVKFIFLIYNFKQTHNISYSLSFLHFSNIYNILSFGRSRNIITIHTMMSKNNLFSGIIMRMFVRLYRFSAKMITVSDEIKEDLVNEFKLPLSKITRIYNPIDIAEIQLRAEDSISHSYQNLFQEKDVILNFGRLENSKGQWHLIRACKKLLNSNSKLHLAILGSGSLQKRLEKLILNLGLKQKITIIPFTKNPFSFVKRSKLVVLSSKYEGLPNVIIEGLVCKRPVVSTDCKSGPREILAPDISSTAIIDDIYFGKYGILTAPFEEGFNYDDVEVSTRERNFGKAIEAILNDAPLYEKYEQRALTRAQDFDISKISEEYYNHIVKS